MVSEKGVRVKARITVILLKEMGGVKVRLTVITREKQVRITVIVRRGKLEYPQTSRK